MRGERPGPTVMVQGGIQGDEAAGYLTAQILTRATVHNGTLIVVPRANVPTVHARARQINVDLNRRFDKDYNSFYEDRLARVIRYLLSRSDALIHLHEGSGFYRPTYEDQLRNPGRYGQSIIIDTPVFQNRINLAEVATNVLAQLNDSIVPAYRFTLFNTNTFSTDTTHPEQRKSLTYHALKDVGIPALAIEVSKDIIQLGWKVVQQLRATGLVLEQYGVSVTLPEITEAEVDRYARKSGLVRVNGRTVTPGDALTLSLPPGSRIEAQPVSGEDATDWSPVPAVFASDRPGVNILDAPRLALTTFSSLDVRADGKRMSSLTLNWPNAAAGRGQRPAKGKPLFVCWLNKRLLFVPADETIETVAGDQFVIEGVWKPETDGRQEILNFKGYVSQRGANSGQDVGQEIILDPDVFLGRFVERGDDLCTCRVVRETPGQERSEFRIAIRPRTVRAAVLVDADGHESILPWTNGGSARLAQGSYTLKDLWSNGDRDRIIATVDEQPIPWDGTVQVTDGRTVTLCLRQATTFRELGRMDIAGDAPALHANGAPSDRNPQ
nr:M14/M99 family metallopeptidase [Desulfobaculum xiamenense]